MPTTAAEFGACAVIARVNTGVTFYRRVYTGLARRYCTHPNHDGQIGKQESTEWRRRRRRWRLLDTDAAMGVIPDRWEGLQTEVAVRWAAASAHALAHHIQPARAWVRAKTSGHSMPALQGGVARGGPWPAEPTLA